MFLDIIASSLVSSLGYNIQVGCAAARAGVVRATSLDYETRAHDGSPQSAVGHVVTSLTRGFGGDARLIRLLAEALSSLQPACQQFSKTSRIGCYLALPCPSRIRSCAKRVPSDQQELWADELAYKAPIEPLEQRAQRIMQQALLAAGLDELQLGQVETSAAGRTALPDLLARATQGVRTRSPDAILVACVDSLTDDETLRWLDMTQRLKAGNNPSGLMPGEAAAAFLLTPSDRQSKSVPLGCLRAAQIRSSNNSFSNAASPSGRAIAHLLYETSAATTGPNLPPWIVSDLNGESFRASELGQAVTQLRAGSPDYTPSIWIPAMSFGDTAVASPGVGICLALEAFRGGYAPAPWAVIVNAADDTNRSVVVLEQGKRV